MSDMNDFMARIERMNRIFDIPCNDQLTDLGRRRMCQFHEILQKEIFELTPLTMGAPDRQLRNNEVVAFADVLADVIVYAVSEAKRWGIPLVPILHAVMDSQDSKLVDGKPIKDVRTDKFLKGPNYKPPEAEIKKIMFGNEQPELEVIIENFGYTGVDLARDPRRGPDGSHEYKLVGKCSQCSTTFSGRLLRAMLAGLQEDFNCVECHQLISRK